MPSTAASGTGRICTSRGVPSVRVPVLSNATWVLMLSFSRTTADLTSTPWRPALAIADSSGGMVDSTSAHGEATIMNVIARSRVDCRSAPSSSGMVNSAIVATTMPIE